MLLNGSSPRVGDFIDQGQVYIVEIHHTITSDDLEYALLETPIITIEISKVLGSCR